MAERIINRYDTRLNWERYNPILKEGELCVEIDSGLLKVGVGNRWKDTIYYGQVPSSPQPEPPPPLGDGTTNHGDLTWESRSMPNQHPISSIIDLEKKLNVHIGPGEPETPAEVWLRPAKPGTPDPPTDSWQVLYSTPLIRFGHVIQPLQAFDESAPIKLVVLGTLEGVQFKQELHIRPDKHIIGEVIIFLEDDPDTSITANIDLLLANGQFYVVGFESTGQVTIDQFYAHRLEVFV